MPGTRPRADRPQREHRPPTSLRDEVVLEVLGERWVASDLAEALGELAATLAEHAAQAAELGRGRVTQVGSVLLDRTPDLLGDREQGRVDVGDDVHERRNVVPSGERPAGSHARLNRAADVHERARVERAAAPCELGCLAHVGRATEVGLGGILDQRDRLARLLLAQTNDGRLRRRSEGSPQGRPRDRSRLPRRAVPARREARAARDRAHACCECTTGRALVHLRRVSYQRAWMGYRDCACLSCDGQTFLLTDGGTETAADLPRWHRSSVLRHVPAARAPTRAAKR